MDFFQRLADGFKDMWASLKEGFGNFGRTVSGMFTPSPADSGPSMDPMVRATPAPIEERFVPPAPAAAAPARDAVVYDGRPLTDSFRGASLCRSDPFRPGLVICSASGYPSGYVPDVRGHFTHSAHNPYAQELAIQRGVERAMYQATRSFLSGYRSPFR